MTNEAIHTQEITIMGRSCRLIFYSGRPYHYLYFRLDMDDYGDDNVLMRNVFLACRGVTEHLSEKARRYFHKKDNTGLMPEARTYYPWSNGFLWEFWVEPSEVNCEELMEALEPETIAKKVEEYCRDHR